MTLSIIRAAIQERKIITFAYKGLKRVCEPHVLGVVKQSTQVMCYQTGGETSHGTLPEWRRFDLAGISDLEVTGETFSGARPFPQGKHSIWDTILETVK